MGLIKGSASFVEFIVDGNLPKADTFNFIADRVKQFSFKDIDDTYDEYSVGWVSVLNMFDSSFAYSNHVVGDYVVLSLRVDERKVPGAILKKCIALEVVRVKAEKQIPKIGRAMLAEIKMRVRTDLIRKAKPTPTVADVLWDTANNRVLLFSTNKSMQAILQDWFKETFGLDIAQVNPDELLIAAINASPNPSYITTEPVIGREFLTWLWYRSTEDNGIFHIGDDINIEVGDKIHLESVNPGEKVVCSNSDDEARKALAVGKMVEQIDLIIDRDEIVIPLTLTASTFYYKGVKLPKTAKTESGEEDGFILERVYLFLKALDSVRDLFNEFVNQRISSDWSAGQGLLLDQWRLDEKVNEID